MQPDRKRPQRMRRTAIAIGAGTVFAALVSGIALAQSSGGAFRVVEHTVDGGGGRSSAGAFIVRGTVGQPDAGPAPGGAMNGGAFRVAGGFWPSTRPAPDLLLEDGFENP